MRIANISTGFSEVPGQISLNIYAQGCKIACKGCQNADLIPFDGGKEVTNNDFLSVIEGRSLPTFICWLGGDATFQPEDLKSANKLFKSKGYNICLYTGQQFSEIQDLLDDVDMVVDGKWEGKKVDESETNQRVYIKQNNLWNNVMFSEVKEILKNHLK